MHRHRRPPTHRPLLRAVVLATTIAALQAMMATPSPAAEKEPEAPVHDAVVRVVGLAEGLAVSRLDEREVTVLVGDTRAVTDRWAGESCVSSSGRYAAVTAFPTEAVNDERLLLAGALAFVVDFDDGTAVRLPFTASTAYNAVGCGLDDQATFTRFTEDFVSTSVHLVDLRRPQESTEVTVDGQATSAVPFGRGLLAARDKGLVEIDVRGAERVRSVTGATPFQLRPTRPGKAVMLTLGGEASVSVHRLDERGLRKIAGGRAGSVGLLSPRAGVVRLVGRLGGGLAPTPGVEALAWDGPLPSSVGPDGSWIDSAGQVHRRGRAPAPAPTTTDRSWTTATDPVLASRSADAFAATAAVDQEPTCAIPRNDPRQMARQATHQQIVWAARQAILNAPQERPAGWLPDTATYRPSDLFPVPALTASGGRIPASVAWAIAVQESNMQQASRRALPGVSANPTLGNYYGTDENVSTISFEDADCGYGAFQVTSGMRRTDSTYSELQKRAIALDYRANAAAGLQILADKWHQLQGLGITMNNGDPLYVENLYGAAWAYNTGVRDPYEDGNRGLGWANNPINNMYPPDRLRFLESNPDDARTPNRWPYQEPIMGWTYRPLWIPNPAGAYPPVARYPSIPARTAFCQPAINHCDPTYTDDGSPESLAYCTRDDFHCWWDAPLQWVSCNSTKCARTIATGVVTNEPGQANNYPPNCNKWLPRTPYGPGPATTILVDDVPPGTPNVEGCPDAPSGTIGGITYGGTMTLTRGSDASGVPLAEMVLHQLGTGWGGHTFFADSSSEAAYLTTATWRTPPVTGVYTAWAHIPSSGATNADTTYTVTTQEGVRSIAVDQGRHRYEAHTWVPLVTASFSGVVTITTSSRGVAGTTTAFDAVALTPARNAPLIVLGDSYAANEGLRPFESATNTARSRCHRSTVGWARQIKLSGSSAVNLACSGAVVADAHASNQYPDQGRQLGLIPPRAKHIVSSLGGNDFLFADVLEICHEEGALGITVLCREGSALDDTIRSLQGPVTQNLVEFYQSVRRQAPPARLTIVGYPRLFHPDGEGYTAVTPTAQRWLNSVADLVAAALRDVATQVNATFVDTRASFVGHDVGTADDTRFIDGAYSGTSCGFVACRSFHPTNLGAAEYARLVQRVLDGL